MRGGTAGSAEENMSKDLTGARSARSVCDSVIAGPGLRASRVRRSGWVFGGPVVRVCGGMPYMDRVPGAVAPASLERGVSAQAQAPRHRPRSLEK